MTTLLGYTSVGAEDIGNWDGQCYCRFIALDTGTLDTLKWYLGDINGTYMRLAIYSDNAGAVDNVLAQGVVSSPTAYTWMELTGLSVSLTKDAYYWIACCWDGISRRETSGGTIKYIASTGNVSFANDPADLTDNSSKVSCYGTGIVTYPVTIDAVAMAATAAAGAPAVTAGTDAQVLAEPATCSAAAAAPSVTAELYCTITGAAATATGAAGAPVIDTWAEAVVGPCHNDALFPPPTVTGDSMAAAAVASAAAAAPAPAFTAVTTAEPPAASATALFAAPSFFTRWHVILAAKYYAEAPDINRAYIVGQSSAGLQVSGLADSVADIALVGERLEVKHDPAVLTSPIAAAVAAAVLAAARLDSKRGSITISPHCGLVLWDILTLVDTVANQDTNYRVCGYITEYDTRLGVYQHTIDLCAP